MFCSEENQHTARVGKINSEGQRKKTAVLSAIVQKLMLESTCLYHKRMQSMQWRFIRLTNPNHPVDASLESHTQALIHMWLKDISAIPIKHKPNIG